MPAREIPVPLRWSDMDAYGHVNNVQFLRLLEDARVLAFRGPHGDEVADSGARSGTVVARNEIEYLRPLRYQYEPVTVALWVSGITGASFDVGYEVRGRAVDSAEAVTGDDDGWVCYARAESTLVFYDLAAARPRRLTGREREALEELWGEPVPLRRRAREQRLRAGAEDRGPGAGPGGGAPGPRTPRP